MYYCKTYNTYILENNLFQLGENRYGANWLNQATPEEKIALGLEEVIDTNQPEDDRFYWVSSTLIGAERTYINTVKDFDQLKINWTQQIKHDAYCTLLSSDWMVTKSIETQTEMPAEWKTYRASIRTTAADAIVKLKAARGIAAFREAIQVNWPNNPDYISLEEVVSGT